MHARHPCLLFSCEAQGSFLPAYAIPHRFYWNSVLGISHTNRERNPRAYSMCEAPNAVDCSSISHHHMLGRCQTCSNDHAWIVFLLIPIGFVACSCYTVYLLPKRMKVLDTKFLHTYAFLFFRFKPDAQVFTVCFILRNLFIALAPPLPNPIVQVLPCLNRACIPRPGLAAIASSIYCRLVS